MRQASNYPPGVTGREPQIQGEPDCLAPTVGEIIAKLKAARRADLAESERLRREEEEALKRASDEQFASAVVAAFAAEGCPELAEHGYSVVMDYRDSGGIQHREVRFVFAGHRQIRLWMANNASRSGGCDWRKVTDVDPERYPCWIADEADGATHYSTLADALLAAEIAEPVTDDTKEHTPLGANC
jgi:hypothetical protein